MNHPAALAAIPIAALAACAGPRWTVAPPANAVVYIDGQETRSSSMPMRYYGTTAVDALPKPDVRFPTSPERRLTTNNEPVSPWLFPFDFPIECIVRLLHGTGPVPLAAAAQANAPSEPGAEAVDLDELRARAFAARTSR